MGAAEKFLRSGELAQLTGLSADTLRYYERIGVLPQSTRTASGYRIYRRAAADRVRLVQGALRMGFTLAELAEIFQACDSGGVPSPGVLNMTKEKLRSLEQQVQELRRTQRYIREILRQ